MENLMLATVAHLPTVVLYMMDLSGGAEDMCSSMEDQLVPRRELRARFPMRPWINIVSEVNQGIVDGIWERLAQILEE
jgi:nucleolar GTP-binding protein